MSCYFNGLSGLELAKQQQDEQHYQNNAEKAHSGVAVAVAVAAEPAAEAAQQENDQDDDKYQSKRHGVLPKQRSANWKSAAPPLRTRRVPAIGSMEGTENPARPGWAVRGPRRFKAASLYFISAAAS